MATMFPKDLTRSACPQSERVVFEALKEQLPEDVRVFHSVVWYRNVDGRRENSESDFVIFDPKQGFLVLEVKGGLGLFKEDDQWRLLGSGGWDGPSGLSWDADEEEGGYRVLPRSPFEQAEQGMRFFSQYFEQSYGERFPGTYGYACVFPRYNVEQGFGPEGPQDLIIDARHMDRLKERIDQLFYYWRGRKDKKIYIGSGVKDQFTHMIRRSIALSAVTGSLLKEQEQRLQEANRTQDSILDLLENYRQIFLLGGAGTGKTWLALKKAIRLAQAGKQVLLLCYNQALMGFLTKQAETHPGITVSTFGRLISKVIGGKTYHQLWPADLSLPGVFDELDRRQVPKYDAVIVDEAQDFNEEWAISARLFLRDDLESHLWVFYDINQNIYHQDFKNGFAIDAPPFVLSENLRNTSAIYQWAVDQTGLGGESRLSTIPGSEPEKYQFTRAQDARKKLDSLLDNLVGRELVPPEKILVLSDRRLENSFFKGNPNTGSFILTDDDDPALPQGQIHFKTIQSYKGLESDVVIFLQYKKKTKPLNPELSYVAYTRAKFYLYVVEYEEG